MPSATRICMEKTISSIHKHLRVHLCNLQMLKSSLDVRSMQEHKVVLLLHIHAKICVLLSLQSYDIHRADNMICYYQTIEIRLMTQLV